MEEKDDLKDQSFEEDNGSQDSQTVEEQDFNEEEVEEVTDSELDKLQADYDDLDERFIRLQAELQNLQRRNKLDREASAKYRAQDLARDLLPAIDNLERALEIEVETEQGQNLKKGVEMTLESLHQALKNNKVELINPLGEPFDPNFHEAYTQVPAQEDQESGTVAQVFEKGYVLHDRVLRAAKVAVVQ